MEDLEQINDTYKVNCRVQDDGLIFIEVPSERNDFVFDTTTNKWNRAGEMPKYHSKGIEDFLTRFIFKTAQSYSIARVKFGKITHIYDNYKKKTLCGTTSPHGFNINKTVFPNIEKVSTVFRKTNYCNNCMGPVNRLMMKRNK